MKFLSMNFSPVILNPRYEDEGYPNKENLQY